MLSRVRARLSYANVVATLGLFIALGGASYAAVNLPNNSVGASEIKRNAVRAQEIRARSVGTSEAIDNSINAADIADGALGSADLADGSLRGADVADDSLTGADIVEGSLSGVPGTVRNIAVRSNSGTGTVSVSCNSGEVASGGGGFGDFASTYLSETQPLPGTGVPTGWEADYRDVATSDPDPGTTYVICVQPS
jgi:hypothetical protein